ncbi:hypothetical protein V6N12_023520 [Hibiscus sabdariffa]|uniref:Uncharacterized protein n=1 Tax=Hibiscus sabdariffa TaxID=183260 RepID=A0ABR2FXW9_9ROSI
MNSICRRRKSNIALSFTNFYLKLAETKVDYPLSTQIANALTPSQELAEVGKVSILIATNVARRIEEVIEVEIGDIVFQVGVKEVGFNDGTSYPLCNTGIRSLSKSEGSDESTGVSKSDSGTRVDVECSDRSRPSMEEEALQTMCTERNGINGVSRDEEALMGQINLSELMGGEPNTLPVTSIEGLEKAGSRGSVDLRGINEEIGEDCVGLIHKDSIGELGLGSGPMSIVGPVLNRNEGELVNIPKEAMGLDVLKDGGNCDPPLVKNLTWADKVKLNVGQHGLRDNPVVGASDVVLEGGFIAECEEIKGRRRKGKARKGFIKESVLLLCFGCWFGRSQF